MPPTLRRLTLAASVYAAVTAAGCTTPARPPAAAPAPPPVVTPAVATASRTAPDGPILPVAATVPAGSQPGTLTAADLEAMAVRGNPTLAQAVAQIEASRGRAVQSGLYPNPEVGYRGEQIGAMGRAGYQGAFVEQTIVTGGKLQLNRAKFGAETSEVEWQAQAHYARVTNTVRMLFFRSLAYQRLEQTEDELIRQAHETAGVAERRAGAGKDDNPDVLEARREAKRLESQHESTGYQRLAAWRELAAAVGQPDLPMPELQADLDAPGMDLDWDAALADLLANSPELQIARAEVRRNQFALQREQVEPIPNLRVQSATQYDFSSEKVIAMAQVGVRLPVFDDNRGNICAARAELARVEAGLARTDLSLRQRLAATVGEFRSAQSDAKTYREEFVPQSRKVLELRRAAYSEGKAAWLDVKDALRDYAQLSRLYVQVLLRLRKAEVAICGHLLVDGLDEPPPPPSQGQPQRKDEQRRLEQRFKESIIDEQGRRLEDRLGNQAGQQ
jgi:outer membrane protein, heavy metal efflux system